MKTILLLFVLLPTLPALANAQNDKVPGYSSAARVNSSITFCNQVARQIPRHLTVVFADYRFSVGADGKPQNVEKYGLDQFKDSTIATCIGKWRIDGIEQGSGFLVSWKYENSKVIQTVVGTPFTHTLEVFDTRPDPDWEKNHPYDPNQPSCILGEQTLGTLMSPKLMLEILRPPKISMTSALEIAERFADKQGIDRTPYYLSRAEIEIDTDRQESFWRFRWLGREGPFKDLLIRVSMAGVPAFEPSPFRSGSSSPQEKSTLSTPIP